MSPVTNFESHAEACYARVLARGARVMTSSQALREISVN
jgi:hypothetical protein